MFLVGHIFCIFIFHIFCPFHYFDRGGWAVAFVDIYLVHACCSCKLVLSMYVCVCFSLTFVCFYNLHIKLFDSIVCEKIFDWWCLFHYRYLLINHSNALFVWHTQELSIQSNLNPRRSLAALTIFLPLSKYRAPAAPLEGRRTWSCALYCGYCLDAVPSASWTRPTTNG